VAYVRRKSNAFTRGKSRYRGVSGHNGRWEARIGTFGGRKNVRCGQASCARVLLDSGVVAPQPSSTYVHGVTASLTAPAGALPSMPTAAICKTGLPSEMRFSISATISER